MLLTVSGALPLLEITTLFSEVVAGVTDPKSIWLAETPITGSLALPTKLTAGQPKFLLIVKIKEPVSIAGALGSLSYLTTTVRLCWFGSTTFLGASITEKGGVAVTLSRVNSSSFGSGTNPSFVTVADCVTDV